MATQFGYITLFGVVWPISPLWSLVNNVVSSLSSFTHTCHGTVLSGGPQRQIELRSDAFKLATQARRPIPTRAASIGPWLDVLVSPNFPLRCRLTATARNSCAHGHTADHMSCFAIRQGFITYVGSLTTSSLVYLYQERSTIPGKSAVYLAHLTHKNVTLPASGASTFWATRLSEAQSITLPPPSDAPQLMGALPPATGGADALAAVKSLLLTAAIIALVSSQAYAAARALARWLLVRLEWDDSIAHQLVRRRDLELKRAWLDEHDIRLTPKEMTRRAMGWAEKQTEDDEAKSPPPANDDLKKGFVGTPADAAADLGTASQFWQQEDVGRRLVHVHDKTE